MRRKAKVDSNQREIVQALRQLGASVTHLHGVGGGCPDLAVGCAGKTTLAEIKAEGTRTKQSQLEWRAAWRGATCVLRSVDDACELIEEMRK